MPVPADGEDGLPAIEGNKAGTKTILPVSEAFMTARERATCLDFANLPVTARTARLEWRRSWVEQALAAIRAPLRLPEQHRGSEHPL